MRRATRTTAALSALLVTACGPRLPEPAPAVRLPASLTAPCIHEADPQTVGELMVAYAEARLTIAQCNERLARIRELGR